MRKQLLNLCVCVPLAATVCGVLTAQEPVRPELNADSLTFNRQTNLLEARHARFVRGNIRVEADESVANGVDFEQSTEWRFKGHVKITVDRAVLEADSAVFTFDSKQLARADLDGAPASFSDLGSTQQKPVRGGARKLVYDHVARTLELSDDAWINKDEAEFRSCGLIYDFNARRVTSGPTDCGVRLLLPQKPKPKTPPAPPPQ